ncbi:MAG: energy-coupling factor transporter transmembrane protein EcfT [Treponema sp.]|jgi:cobalt/nickel transport system permease protein|nr:energy-coupling factor transporter transmembrane protein EcfT [Treponema sp.]
MYLDRLEFKRDPFQGFDPRCRVLAAVCLILVVLTITHPVIEAIIMVGTVVPFLMGKTGTRELRKLFLRLIPVNIVTLILWLSLLLNGLGVHDPGGPGSLERLFGGALLYTLRINAAALVYMVLIIPLGIGRLANGLMKLKVPATLVSLLVLTYRYIFVMYQGVFVSVLSMQSRRPRQTTLEQWRSYTAVFASALVKAMLRAQKIGNIMELRGFTGVLPITTVFIWKLQDTLLLGACIILAPSLWVLDRLWNCYG